MKLNVTPLMEAIEAYILKADNDLEEQLEAEGFVSVHEAVKAVERIDDALRDTLEKDADKLLDRIRTATGIDTFISDTWPDIHDSDALRDALEKIFQKEFDSLMHQFTYEWIVSDVPDHITVPTDGRISKPAEEFIHSWSGRLAEIMNLNTKDMIERILLDAHKDNLTIEEVSDMIANSGIRECGYRSRRVAVTEVLRVESYAQQESMVQNPLCYAKKWVHMPSAHPRENHVAMDGQQVFKRERFTLIGRNGATYRPACPRDTGLPASESVNCHCIMQMVADDNALGMTDDEWQKLRDQALDEIDEEWELEHENDRTLVDSVLNMDEKDRLRYFGGKKNDGAAKAALIESGVIDTDRKLEAMWKVDSAGKKRMKTLQELSDDGIFTISDGVLQHATLGDYTNIRNTKKPAGAINGGNMKGGGHSQLSIDELDRRGIKYEISEVFDNGVRVGGVDFHTDKWKRLGTGGQTWFPEDWADNKVRNAGTYTANNYALRNEIKTGDILVGYECFAEYDGVIVGVITDVNGIPGTVYPDKYQRELK